MSNFIQDANWRYATKKFDATKKVSTQDFNTLKEAIRLSSSSYGLQPYKILFVENPELRAKLQPVSWGQSQVVDASHLIVFAIQTNVGDKEIDAYFKNVTQTRQIPNEAIAGYSGFMKSKISTLSEDEKNIWSSKQTYLALGNLLNAAAELKVDVTPMEGFDPIQYNEILGLSALGLHASLVATIGYRSTEDDTQHYAKVRKSNEDLFITL